MTKVYYLQYPGFAFQPSCSNTIECIILQHSCGPIRDLASRIPAPDLSGWTGLTLLQGQLGKIQFGIISITFILDLNLIISKVVIKYVHYFLHDKKILCMEIF